MRNLKGGEKGLIERTITEALGDRKKFSAQFKGPQDFLVAITESPAQAEALLNVVLNDPFCFSAVFSKVSSTEDIEIMKALAPELRQRFTHQIFSNPNQFVMMCGDLPKSIIEYDNAFPDQNNQFSRCVLSNSTLFSEFFNNEKG